MRQLFLVMFIILANSSVKELKSQTLGDEVLRHLSNNYEICLLGYDASAIMNQYNYPTDTKIQEYKEMLSTSLLSSKNSLVHEKKYNKYFKSTELCTEFFLHDVDTTFSFPANHHKIFTPDSYVFYDSAAESLIIKNVNNRAFPKNIKGVNIFNLLFLVGSYTPSELVNLCQLGDARILDDVAVSENSNLIFTMDLNPHKKFSDNLPDIHKERAYSKILFELNSNNINQIKKFEYYKDGILTSVKEYKYINDNALFPNFIEAKSFSIDRESLNSSINSYNDPDLFEKIKVRLKFRYTAKILEFKINNKFIEEDYIFDINSYKEGTFVRDYINAIKFNIGKPESIKPLNIRDDKEIH